MKISIISFRSVLACILFLLFLSTVSCSRFGDADMEGEGLLCISFDDFQTSLTRSVLSVPDTNDFRLLVSDSSGKVVYDGAFGDCPEAVSVPSGSYNITALSCDFRTPAFDCPQFGDEQCVVVPSGGRTSVKLECAQLNAGVRLEVSPDFLVACPGSVLFLKCPEGKLMISYSEKRTAYFPSGPVTLVMSTDGKDESLVTKDLEPADMLTLKVSVSDNAASGEDGLTMSVDTSRVWYMDEYVIGSPSDGGASEVLTVAQAKATGEKEDVWVSGYIVGGDLTSASASFDIPFKSRTNLLLGPKSSTSDKEACVSVQLSSGDVREALNLVDNPNLLKKRVRVKGDIVDAYYGIVGIKNVVDFQFIN